MAKINCHVNACKYNDEGKVCSLESIVVGNSAPQPHCCADTECDSFEE